MPFEREQSQRVAARAVRCDCAGGRYSATGWRPGSAKRALENANVASRATAGTRSAGPTAPSRLVARCRRRLRPRPRASRPGPAPSVVIVEAVNTSSVKPSRAASSRATSAFDFDSPIGSMAASFHERYENPHEPTRSACSSIVVAGRTMSANRAVSVRNWSCTTVNRSSRRNPRSTCCWSAAITAGLLFQTYRLRIGGASVRVGEHAAELDHVDLDACRPATDRVATETRRIELADRHRPVMPPAGQRH